MRAPWIIGLAIILHFMWGVLLILDDSTGFVTAISDTRDFFGVSSDALGTIYLLASLASLVSLWVETRWLRVLLIIPQQFMLWLSAYAAGDAIVNAQFADGVVRPRAFLFADQVTHVVNFTLHGFAVLDREGVTIWNRRPSRGLE